MDMTSLNLITGEMNVTKQDIVAQLKAKASADQTFKNICVALSKRLAKGRNRGDLSVIAVIKDCKENKLKVSQEDAQKFISHLDSLSIGRLFADDDGIPLRLVEIQYTLKSIISAALGMVDILTAFEPREFNRTAQKHAWLTPKKALENKITSFGKTRLMPSEINVKMITKTAKNAKGQLISVSFQEDMSYNDVRELLKRNGIDE